MDSLCFNVTCQVWIIFIKIIIYFKLCGFFSSYSAVTSISYHKVWFLLVFIERKAKNRPIKPYLYTLLLSEIFHFTGWKMLFKAIKSSSLLNSSRCCLRALEEHHTCSALGGGSSGKDFWASRGRHWQLLSEIHFLDWKSQTWALIHTCSCLALAQQGLQLSTDKLFIMLSGVFRS